MAFLRQIYYDLACVPVLLMDASSKERLQLDEAVKLELLILLNKGAEKRGLANVLIDGLTVKCSRLAEMVSGKKEVVTECTSHWVILNNGFILPPVPSLPLRPGTEVLLKNLGNGSIQLEVTRQLASTVLTLPELCSLHYTIFPLNPKEVAEVETYPETVGNQRIRIEHLKQLKRFKPEFALQVNLLKEEFSSWRKSRGDGNCYYRAVAYSYLEHLCRFGVSSQSLREFYMRIYLQIGEFSLSSWGDQFDKYFICVLIRLKELMTVKELTGASVEHLEYIYLQDHDFDASMIKLLKLSVFNYLQANKGEFSEFLARPLEEMQAEVLADGLESEGVVFQVMANVLDAAIVHVLLPENMSTVCKQEFLPKNAGRKPVLTLLLRPGHYDILYPLEADLLDRYNFSTYSYTSFDPDLHILTQLYKNVA